MELPLVAHSLLMFIDTEPGAHAVDITTAYGLEKSTVSRQVAHLEDAAALPAGVSSMKVTPSGCRDLAQRQDKDNPVTRSLIRLRPLTTIRNHP